MKYYFIAFEKSTFEIAYELGFKHMQYFLKSIFEFFFIRLTYTQCSRIF